MPVELRYFMLFVVFRVFCHVSLAFFFSFFMNYWKICCFFEIFMIFSIFYVALWIVICKGCILCTPFSPYILNCHFALESKNPCNLYYPIQTDIKRIYFIYFTISIDPSFGSYNIPSFTITFNTLSISASSKS